MRHYQIKSAEKIINGEPLPGYAVFRNEERIGFVNVFNYWYFKDFVNHINDGFYIFEEYMKAKNETIG